jgi:opacity protein-like surface antigen
MKVKLLGLAALAALSCMPAQAATIITQVTNDWNATNGCTVRSVAGYGGYDFQVSVFGVKCPNDPEVYPEKVWRSWGCEMRIYTSGYSVSGPCGNYRIWRN